MAATQLANVVRHLHQIVRPLDGHERSDAQLLQCFLGNRDESAFRLLVERHGGMVLSVCRHVLRQRQDAEDAFQATFLILAQNAGSIRKGTALASWLYGVAYRTALKLRTQTSRRQRHEKRAAKMEQTGPELDLALRELQAVLAEEVNRLPEKLRAPFVLCCLEGKSRPEAARQLGWKEGTVFGRVAEARKRLQQRLTRRGLTLASALCALALESSTSAAVPPLLMRSTLQGALGVAAGRAAASLVAAPVASLVEGAKQTMFVSKVKLAALVLLATGLVAGGAGVHLHRAFATAPEADQPAASAASKADKPAEEKTGALTVHGQVVDADGQPIAGARLFMPGAFKGPIMKDDPPLVQETSGAKGDFRFTIHRAQLVPGRWLQASADGFGGDAVEAEKLAGGEIKLRLVKDQPVAGRVLDLEGHPVKDVTVTVRRVQASPSGDLTPVLKSIQHDGNRVFTHPLRDVHLEKGSGMVLSVKTDAAGRFRLTGLGKDRVAVLWVEGPTIEYQVLYVLTRPGLNIKELIQSAPDRIGLGKSRLPLPAIYGPTFDHTARPTKPITGVVRNKATGKPVADVYINGSAHGWWENYVQTKTDKEGRYRLVGLPKTQTYHLSAYGAEQGYLPAGQSVGDSEGLAPATLDFELVRGIRVTGRVTDKTTGKPVPTALWYTPLLDNKYFPSLPGKDWYRNSSQGLGTKPDGTFSVLALPGSGLIKFRAEVQPENPYIQVTMDPADRPKAYSATEDELGESFISVGNTIEHLAGHNAYRLIDPAPDAESITCDVQLDRGVTRAGKVVDPDGKPLTGVRACGLEALGGNKTIADSSFQAIGLNPARPRMVTFYHKKRKLVAHILLRADAKEPVTVRLQPGAVLTGRVVDEDGKPLAGVRVYPGYRTNQARWLADEIAADQPAQTTDAEGRFRVEGIFPGLSFGVGLRKGDKFLVPEETYQKMTLPSGAKDLGNIEAKPFRPG